MKNIILVTTIVLSFLSITDFSVVKAKDTLKARALSCSLNLAEGKACR